MPTTNYTTAVSVTFEVHSLDNPAPYEVKKVSGTVDHSQTGQTTFTGWNALDIGTPEPNGATFTLMVADKDYSTSNATTVANWAVTFIPRGATNGQSPFGNNVNTIAGSSASNNGTGTFTLPINNVTIKSAGDWDWALMIQMVLPGSLIKCFSSDPEMEVDT
jgi:hypothetical protein